MAITLSNALFSKGVNPVYAFQATDWPDANALPK